MNQKNSEEAVAELSAKDFVRPGAMRMSVLALGIWLTATGNAAAMILFAVVCLESLFLYVLNVKLIGVAKEALALAKSAQDAARLPNP